MQRILLSDFDNIPGEHDVINSIFELGIDAFHLRKKNFTTHQTMEYLDKIDVQYHQKVVLHHDYHLLDKYNLMGSHFIKKYDLFDFLEDSVNEHLNKRIKKLHMSFSVHSFMEIKKLEYDFNYVFISPVFDSISNRGYNSRIKINSFKQFLSEEKNRPGIIALGGIKDENIPKIHAAGFDGFAVLGFVWNFLKKTGNVQGAVDRMRLIMEKDQEYQSLTLD